MAATLQISYGIWAALGLWAWENTAVDWEFWGTLE